MALPTAYLTSVKNLKAILEAIKGAQAPKRFTVSFLQSLGFKNASDRLILGLLKALAFLSPSGEPTQRYYEFLDKTQSPQVLASGIREAYADLFQVNTKAHDLSSTDVQNKLKTLTQGQFTDAVLQKMATTFKSLCALADFAASPKPAPPPPPPPPPGGPGTLVVPEHPSVTLGGLVYNIQIHLPESRDPAVYDALFKSLKEHLLR
jgi:hypothetical protein